MKVRKAVREHTAYEELGGELPRNLEDPFPLQELKETDHVYKIFASPLNVNWVPLQVEESQRGLTSTPEHDTFELLVPTASASRSRTDETPQSASTDCTTSTIVQT